MVMVADEETFAYGADNGDEMTRVSRDRNGTWALVRTRREDCTRCGASSLRERRTRLTCSRAAAEAFQLLSSGGRVVYGIPIGKQFYNRLDERVAAAQLSGAKATRPRSRTAQEVLKATWLPSRSRPARR